MARPMYRTDMSVDNGGAKYHATCPRRYGIDG